MGQAKREMMEAEDRGWYEPEGHVCSDCVEDEFLKEVIRQHASQRQCDYCGRQTRAHSAAPVAVLMHPIGSAVFYYFNDPTQAGVPYDQGWLSTPTGTQDVLMTLPLACHDQLFEQIAQAFVHTEWVPAAGGHWSSSHLNEELSALWDSFVNIIKYEIRFFFQHASAAKSANPWEHDPRHILLTIDRLVKRLKLPSRLPEKTSLFRARIRSEEADWAIGAEQMGAPPSELARAGRMNPVGISYLYLAFEHETALAEVLSGPPCAAAIARFETQRELRILDLTHLPAEPSIFDEARRPERESLLFLERFVEEISQPVRKDAREHIDYVPSQVVCEYLALVFRVSRNRSLDGIVYPSAVRPGGRNLVLFPTERGFTRLFDQVEFQTAWEREFADWADLSASVGAI